MPSNCPLVTGCLWLMALVRLCLSFMKPLDVFRTNTGKTETNIKAIILKSIPIWMILLESSLGNIQSQPWWASSNPEVIETIILTAQDLSECKLNVLNYVSTSNKTEQTDVKSPWCTNEFQVSNASQSVQKEILFVQCEFLFTKLYFSNKVLFSSSESARNG